MTSCTLTEAPSLFDPAREAGTLDDRLVSLWERLAADRPAQCPLCEGEMMPAYGAHARAIGGKCTTCGSTIQ